MAKSKFRRRKTSILLVPPGNPQAETLAAKCREEEKRRKKSKPIVPQLVGLPFEDESDWMWRWLVFPSYRVLHRVAKHGPEDKTGWVKGFKRATTVCGLTGGLRMPGIFSRMGRDRCAHCCKKLGIPRGAGAPFNKGIDA